MNQKGAIKQLERLERLGAVKEMRLAANDWKEPWQTLIAILMSARTRDETTVIVGEKLFAKYKTASALAKAKPEDVAAIIRPVNFYKNKTKSVIGCAKVLVKEYGGVPPHEITKLTELPGVGRKTANVFLAEYGAQAIGVDTHVAYISRKLGWTKHSSPDKIEKDLEYLFPQNFWNRVNGACVRFGKSYMSRRRKDELLAEVSKISS